MEWPGGRRHLRFDRKNVRVAATAVVTAGLMLSVVHLRRRIDQQIVELRASRTRIAALAGTERRRLERDLHDGAQQRLIACGLALEDLEAATAEHPEATRLVLRAERELRAAVGELRRLANGIHPAILTDRGLWAACNDLTLHVPPSVTTALTGTDPGRLPAVVESTLYFAISEALTNTLKHAHARSVRLDLRTVGRTLRVTIQDDGVGGAATGPGSGLRGIADRLAALDGKVTLTSPPGHGTTVFLDVPCDSL